MLPVNLGPCNYWDTLSPLASTSWVVFEKLLLESPLGNSHEHLELLLLRRPWDVSMLLHCHSRRAEPLTTLSSHQEGTRCLGRGCGGQCDTSLYEKSQEDVGLHGCRPRLLVQGRGHVGE